MFDMFQITESVEHLNETMNMMTLKERYLPKDTGSKIVRRTCGKRKMKNAQCVLNERGETTLQLSGYAILSFVVVNLWCIYLKAMAMCEAMTNLVCNTSFLKGTD